MLTLSGDLTAVAELKGKSACSSGEFEDTDSDAAAITGASTSDVWSELGSSDENKSSSIACDCFRFSRCRLAVRLS